MITTEFSFNDQRFDYASGDLAYRGLNTVHNESVTATTWYIFKYTYGADGISKIEGPLIGSWEGRAALDWA